MMTAGEFGFMWFAGAERDDLLADDDWQRVEDTLRANPLAGDLVSGLRGARKLRVRVGKRGKRGGARTIYFFQVEPGTIYFLATYAKNERGDLSADQRAEILRQIGMIEEGGR